MNEFEAFCKLFPIYIGPIKDAKKNPEPFLKNAARGRLSWLGLSTARCSGKSSLSISQLSAYQCLYTYVERFNIRDGKIFSDELLEKYFPMLPPKEGEFIGWKKACLIYPDDKKTDWLGFRCIVTLLIPEDAKRSSAFGNKCRCSKAKVLKVEAFNEIEELDKRTKEESSKWAIGKSFYNICTDRILYKTGEEVIPSGFDENRWHECSEGIHFFMTREEAENYGV